MTNRIKKALFQIKVKNVNAKAVLLLKNTSDLIIKSNGKLSINKISPGEGSFKAEHTKSKRRIEYLLGIFNLKIE